MQSKYKLSIIVPIYNVENLLKRCLDSLLNQDIDTSDYEIILINDGSTDGSFHIAKDFASKHINISIHNQENRGQSIARNYGLDIATGKYVTFVDSDDYLVERSIGKLIKTAEEYDTDLCFSTVIYQHPNGHFEKLPTPFKEANKVINGEYALLRGYKPSSAWAIIYRRDFIESQHMRFFPGISHEDVEFTSRIIPYAKRILYSDIYSYVYCWNDCSTDRSKNTDKIKYGLISNIYVAASLKEISMKSLFSKELRTLYIKKSNSLIVSSFLKLLLKIKTDKSFKKKVLDTATDLDVYPVRGKTLSWKSTILIPIINIKILYYIF